MAVRRNLPNLITGSRLVLALILFVLLHLAASPGPGQRLLFNVSLAIFTLAALSDILDGHLARRWGLQTDFGRIVDPFADKVIVCGAFVELIPLPEAHVAPWMVVLILARELLVDGLRGFAESRGVAFPASWAGKIKMLVQCACLLWVLFALANLAGVAWAQTVTVVMVWAAVLMTALSGVLYLIRARALLRPESLAQGGAA